MTKIGPRLCLMVPYVKYDKKVPNGNVLYIRQEVLMYLSIRWPLALDLFGLVVLRLMTLNNMSWSTLICHVFWLNLP